MTNYAIVYGSIFKPKMLSTNGGRCLVFTNERRAWRELERITPDVRKDAGDAVVATMRVIPVEIKTL